MKKRVIVVRRSGNNDTVCGQLNGGNDDNGKKDILNEEKDCNQIQVVITKERIQEKYDDKEDEDDRQVKGQDDQFKQKEVSNEERKRKVISKKVKDQLSSDKKNLKQIEISTKITENIESFNDILTSDKQSQQQLESTGEQSNPGIVGNNLIEQDGTIKQSRYYDISSDSNVSQHSISYDNLHQEGLENKIFESNMLINDSKNTDPINISTLIARKNIYKTREKQNKNLTKRHQIIQKLHEYIEDSIKNLETNSKPEYIKDLQMQYCKEPYQKIGYQQLQTANISQIGYQQYYQSLQIGNSQQVHPIMVVSQNSKDILSGQQKTNGISMKNNDYLQKAAGFRLQHLHGQQSLPFIQGLNNNITNNGVYSDPWLAQKYQSSINNNSSMLLEKQTWKQKLQDLLHKNKMLMQMYNDNSQLQDQQSFASSIDKDIMVMQRQQTEKEAEEMILKHQPYFQTQKITNILNPIMILDEEDKPIFEEMPQPDENDYQKQQLLSKEESARKKSNKIPEMPVNFKQIYPIIQLSLQESLTNSMFITSNEMGFDEFQKKIQEENQILPYQLEKAKRSAKVIKICRTQKNNTDSNNGGIGSCINSNDNKSIGSNNELSSTNEGNSNESKSQNAQEEKQGLGDKFTMKEVGGRGRIHKDNGFTRLYDSDDEFNGRDGISEKENDKIKVKIEEEQDGEGEVKVKSEEKRGVIIDCLKIQKRLVRIKTLSIIGMYGYNNVVCLDDNHKRKEKNQEKLAYTVGVEEEDQKQQTVQVINKDLMDYENSWKQVIGQQSEHKVGSMRSGRLIVKIKNTNAKQSEDQSNNNHQNIDVHDGKVQSTSEEQNYQIQDKQQQSQIEEEQQSNQELPSEDHASSTNNTGIHGSSLTSVMCEKPKDIEKTRKLIVKIKKL